MKRTGFTITLEDGESHTRYLTPVGIKDGFWLDNTGNKLQQVNGFTTDAFFGENIKIQINTFNVKDGRKIELKIKAQIGGNSIPNFKEIIHTLKVENNIAILDDFYIDPEWYDETIESYYNKNTTVNGFNFKAHQTLVNPDEAITFTFDTKFKDKEWTTSKSLPKLDTDYLKPVTYRRNYEELIGLYSYSNLNGQYDKDINNNYENNFIDSDPKISKIVNKFIKKISSQNIQAVEILDLIDEYAPKLWGTSTKEVQKNNYDDRPLYWARNKMLIYLKRNQCYKGDFNLETSEIYKGTKLDTAITDFENKSRNYTGIDFSKAKNKKKILVTGFDPFQLDPKTYDYNRKSTGPSTFNPAGILALNLDNNKALKKDNIYVQTCIFPVRYEDFDDGCVENIINKHINDVDVIITTSRNNNTWDVEQYAIAYRGGFHCNNNIGNSKPSYNSSRFIPNTAPTITETTLKNKIFIGSNSMKIGTEIVSLDSSKSPTLGSGSNYLSNEVMYRATAVRGATSKKPVGHIHLKDLKDINKQNITINIVKEIIKKII